MPYDESAASRVRALLRRRSGYAEKKMFGGLCFLMHGNMCCGLTGGGLMLRLGADGAAEALREPHTREMDFTGRPMKSMIFVEPDGYASGEALKRWLGTAATFASSLAPK
jgi:hypothetical protein